ncbi:MAG: LysM peptidoglycan-binding domain-containing protein [Prevotella sp.]|nr:LysM peptidoglycan-binding domain-containing protein [Prevotella sp.]
MKAIGRYVLLLLLSLIIGVSTAFAQTNQWRTIHKVKKKDTIFGIANTYGLSIPELMEANPDMKKEGYMLKKGDYVFIPFEKPKESASAQTQGAMKQIFIRSDVRQRAVRVGVMLPLHDIDGDGKRMVEYYRGILMACDSLKRQGISVDIHAWNVSIDADVRQTLLEKGASECDIIFGPLYTRQVKALADFCTAYQIKLVIPFSINGDDVQHYSTVFQIYQSPTVQNEASLKAFMERFPGYHPVIVDCNDSTSTKGLFTLGLRQRLDAKGVKYNITNVNSTDENFAKAFSRKEPNVVILNTGRSPELNSVFAKLNALKAANPGIQISLYGYTEWLMYTKVYTELYHKYDTYIPTTTYYNSLSTSVQKLEQNFRRWFKTDMQYAIPRFAITGYDHAQFFLRGLHQHGAAFKGTKGESTYVPLQTPLKFKPAGDAGSGMQNAVFMLIHYKPNQTIEAVNY